MQPFSVFWIVDRVSEDLQIICLHVEDKNMLERANAAQSNNRFSQLTVDTSSTQEKLVLHRELVVAPYNAPAI